MEISDQSLSGIWNPGIIPGHRSGVPGNPESLLLESKPSPASHGRQMRRQQAGRQAGIDYANPPLYQLEAMLQIK